MARRRKSAAGQRQNAAVDCDQQVVSRYLAALNQALGDESAFTALFNAIKRDGSVRQAEAVALASAFVAPMAKSTAKGKALDSVRRRHKSLRSFQLKRAAASRGSIA
jgi:hypothetical protein